VWEPVLAGMRKQLAAFTRAIPASPPGDAHTTIVSLSREPSADERERAAAEKRRAAARQLWVIVISLAVTVIGISNAMLMSVTERFREIGTMKCLGALSSFIRMLFLIESAFVGAVGSVAGCAAGALFAALAYTGIYGLALTTRSAYGQLSSLALYAAAAVAAGMVLSVVAAIYPASVASRMVPANALRSNV